MTTSTITVPPQDALIALFSKTYSQVGSFSERLSRLARVCGFRDTIRSREKERSNQWRLVGIMEVPDENITEGEFLCLLLIAGIAFFTDTPIISVPKNLANKLERVYALLEPTANFNCAELLFYLCIQHTLLAQEEGA